MQRFGILFLLLFLYLFLARQAEAIVILPAILLIPIAKIVAIIMAGFSLPALGIGTIWSKLNRKSLVKTIMVVMVLLVTLGLVLTLLLKFFNPYRPLF